MPKRIYNETVTAGPFSITFCNTNTAMDLRGHCHFAKVYFTFRTIGEIGFPSFAHTHAEIQQHLQRLTAKPFRSNTNEDVLRILFEFFRQSPLIETGKYDVEFRLMALELHVRGVPDDIGHADGFTVYQITEESCS